MAKTVQLDVNPFTVRGYPDLLRKIETNVYTFNIICAQGQPRSSQLRLSEGCLITKVPGEYFSPPLEFGDHVQKLNGVDISNKAHFYAILERAVNANDGCHTLEVTVERLSLLKPLDRTSPLLPKGCVSYGYEYYTAQLVFFPKAALGMSIKSVARKVFVESTDNGLVSIGRRVFFIGDRIVTVNGTYCDNTAGTKDLIIKSLKKDNIVTVVIERPHTELAVRQVRMALVMARAPQTNPRLPADVMAICKREADRIRQEIVGQKTRVKPVSILKKKGSSEPEQQKITIAAQSTKTSIGSEPFNPAMLVHATGMFNAKGPRKSKKDKKKSGSKEQRKATSPTSPGSKSIIESEMK